jgi:hypothetical protein
MVDFSSLLKKPAGLAVKPAALVAGDYPVKIKSFEVGDQNKNKTPYVRYFLAITGWPDSVAEDDRVQKNPDGSTASIDLSKRQPRRDFFLTDDAMWRLDEFLRSCGVEPKGRSYEEVIPEVVGADCVAEMQQYLNQTSNEIGNQIGKLVGVK